MLNEKIKISHIIGETIKNFAEGAGIYVSAVGLLMIWNLARKPTPREVRK